MKREKRANTISLIIWLVIILFTIYSIVSLVKGSNKKNVISERKIGAVQQLEDGTKINTSETFDKVKMVEGLEIKDMQVTEKNGVSVILANVSNNTTVEKEGFEVDIVFTDENGNEVATVPGYIKDLKAGETTQLNTSATISFVDSYNVEIKKAK